MGASYTPQFSPHPWYLSGVLCKVSARWLLDASQTEICDFPPDREHQKLWCLPWSLPYYEPLKPFHILGLFLFTGDCHQVPGLSHFLVSSIRSTRIAPISHTLNGIGNMGMWWASHCLAHRELLWSAQRMLLKIYCFTNKTNFRVYFLFFSFHFF